MTNVHDLAPSPNADTMREQVYALFKHSMRGLVEVGYTDKSGALNQAKQFDVGDLDDLVAFAARINAQPGHNVYISAGLRRTDMDRDHRAADADVEAVAALKIDCDTPGCFEAALKLADQLSIRPSLVHFTGKAPHIRGALWWVLEEPDPDLERVRRIDAALSRVFTSDPKVVNVSRVMRLPGSVAWPFKQGRVVEMTGVHDAPTRRAPYSLDEMESSLRRHGHNPSDTRAGAAVLDFSQERQSIELESLLEKATVPGEWHESALLAVAHLIGRQCPPDVAIDVLAARLTLPGYQEAQTRAELRVMATSRRALEWAERARKEREAAAPMPAPEGRDPFPLIALKEIGLQPPPEWRVDKMLPEKGTGVLFGASGSFKSFITLDLALTIAYGVSWRGQAVKQAPTAYIAGEGTYGIQNRVMAWRESRGQAQDAPFWLAPVASNFLDVATVKLIGDRLSALGVKFIVVDTLARSFGGGDEDKSTDMGRFIAACDYLRDVCGAFVLAVHHTGHNGERERGSSSLRAAVDVRLGVSRGTSERSAIVHVAKQKDSEDGQKFRVRLVEVETAHPITGEIITSLVPVSENAPVTDVTPIQKLGKNDLRVLQILNEGPQKFGTIRARTGIDSGSVGRALRSLFDKGLACQQSGSKDGLWEITEVATEMLMETNT